jgi:membrane associated rhomboid family serine protease
MSITIIIIAATVAASFYAWNNQDIYQKWMMNPYLVSNKGEYFRFLTSGFIHADQAHLFINMLSFYFFGRNLELFLSYNFGASGMWYYLGFYLLSPNLPKTQKRP